MKKSSTKNMQPPKEDSTHRLGDFVREIRKTQNLTQKQLAALSGTSFNFISQLERGKSSVRYSHVMQILDVLGIKVECRWGDKVVNI